MSKKKHPRSRWVAGSHTPRFNEEQQKAVNEITRTRVLRDEWGNLIARFVRGARVTTRLGMQRRRAA